MKVKESSRQTEDKTNEDKARIIYPSQRENGSYGWREEMVYISDVEERLDQIHKNKNSNS